MQKAPGYHPMIRFSSWQITRLERSKTYMFLTPDFVQQGQFDVQGSTYSFRAVMANELENADVSKLIADMSPEPSSGFGKAYARSMSNFQGTYDESNHALSITYNVDGVPHTYDLHATDEGDGQLAVTAAADEIGLVGLWQPPDPFPGKLDAKTRSKIEEDGLQRFMKEASESEKPLFKVVDLRVNKTFRLHSTIGTWRKTGQTVILSSNGIDQAFQLSSDGQSLLVDGKVALIRA